MGRSDVSQLVERDDTDGRSYMTIIYAIIIFCLLDIRAMSWGILSLAKACGVKVNEFAIGMGPAIFRKSRKGKLFTL